jgi:replicative DNA helicase
MNSPVADPQLAAVRTPPHSIEAEQSVLGGLLLDNSAWDRIADRLVGEDFYRHDHRLIFQHISRLIDHSRPADAITVYEALQTSGKAAWRTSIRWPRIPRRPPTSAAMPRSCASVRCCAA